MPPAEQRVTLNAQDASALRRRRPTAPPLRRSRTLSDARRRFMSNCATTIAVSSIRNGAA
jgi:hypothetical protein